MPVDGAQETVLHPQPPTAQSLSGMTCSLCVPSGTPYQTAAWVKVGGEETGTPMAPPTVRLTGAPQPPPSCERTEHTLRPQSLGRPKPSPVVFVRMPESHFLHATGVASVWLHLCLLLSVLLDPTQDTSVEAPSSALRAKANPSLCDEHSDLGVLRCFFLPWGASPAPGSYFYKDRTQDPPHRSQTPRAKGSRT